MQHAQMMHNRRNFTPPQAPAGPPFPVNLSAVQGMRARSNPEQGQPQPLGGFHRHLPMPAGQFPVPQGHIPLQRLTPSTEVLEHIHPGSTSRGDFHSDPTAHNAMDTYYRGPPDEFVAVASRGLPGPFNYQRLPLPTRPVPLGKRGGTFDGNLPRGKKNPKKKSSDDARMVSNTGNAPHQASKGADPKQPFAQPNSLQMPFYPQSPDAISMVPVSRPSLGAVPVPGNYHAPNLPPSHHSGNGQEPFHHLLYHRQTHTQAPTEGYSRVVSNPYAAPAREMQGPSQDLRSTIQKSPIPSNKQHQGAAVEGNLVEENAGFVSTPVRPQISQPLDPQAFGHQLPDHRTDAGNRQDAISGIQRAALAPMPNMGQPEFPGTPRRSGADEVLRRPVQEVCKIWVGGLPDAIDRAAVLTLLRPCRGLLDICEPKVSLQSRNPGHRAYTFAEYVSPISIIAHDTNLRYHRFRNPVDAAEALERLPQTRFANLPEGVYLSTNYPKKTYHRSSGHYRSGGDVDWKRPALDVSPTKSRKGEDSNDMMKSKNEHGRKPSKESSRVQKFSISSSGGNMVKPHERISAVDAGQKESGAQLEEVIVIPGPHDTADSKTHVSQDSKQTPQDTGIIQPDVGVETHAKQISGSTNDGAQDVSSASNAKPQVQETYRTTSSKNTSKGPKKKSKGSNKLAVPGNNVSEPPTVQPALGSTNSEAPPQSFANDAGKSLGQSGHLEDKGKHAKNGIQASESKVSTVPLDPTPTLPKDLKIVGQSFLGRDPAETDGLGPKASVAQVTKPSDAREDKVEMSETALAPTGSALSAVPLENSGQSTSQAMRRDVSNSTQGSADSPLSAISSTAPPSSLPTERSDRSTQEISSLMVQTAYPSLETTLLPVFGEPGQLSEKPETNVVSSNASQAGNLVISKCDKNSGQSQVRSDVETSLRDVEPGETAVEHGSKRPTTLAPSVVEKGTEPVQKDLQDLIDDDFVRSHLGLVEEDSEKTPSMSLTTPSFSNCDQAILGSPAHKNSPSIPPRSSSLVAPSTPIKTHQKKKPRNLTPVQEGSPSKAKSSSVENTKMDSSLQTTGSTKLVPSVLSIDTAARTLATDCSKDLPKPETPFLMDDGVRVAPPKINRQIVEASNADLYYAQKLDYQVSHLGSAMQTNANFTTLDSSDSISTYSSETSTADYACAKKQNDLETTLRECGYRSLSDTSPFTIKDPALAFLQTIDEEGNPLEDHNKKDNPVLSWIDDKGKIVSSMTIDAWKKQNEMIEVVKKATAVKKASAAKRLLAKSPPLPWTKAESERQQLLQFITHFRSRALDQQRPPAEAPQILEANALLDAFPQRDSLVIEMRKWSRRFSQFMKENASESSPTYAHSGKRTTNSSSESSRGTPSRRQQQERPCPALINKLDPQKIACKRGEDAFRPANAKLDNSPSSGQTTESETSPSTFGRRTPSEEQSTPSDPQKIACKRGEDAFQPANAKLDNSPSSGQTTESETSPSTFGRRTPSEERSTPSVAPMSSGALSPVTKLQNLFVEMGDERQHWSDDRHPVSSPQEEERMTVSDPELEDLDREFELHRVTEIGDMEPEQEVRETRQEVQQKPDQGTRSQSMGKELGSEGGTQDRTLTPKSDENEDPTSAGSDEKASKDPEDPVQQTQTCQLLGGSISSFDSNHTTSNEGSSEEAQHKRPRGGHSPMKRIGYNAVAARGTEGTRGRTKDGSRNPWELPQGEKPWGTGGGEKKKRERQ